MKTAYIIGRFQPFHEGHKAIAAKAISDGIKKIVFLVGSANRSRSIKNPFTFEQRQWMILNSMRSFTGVEVVCKPINDYLYNDNLWINEVFAAIDDPANSMIYGYKKDLSSAYLDWFAGVKLVEVDAKLVDGQVLNATEIRENMFKMISACAKAGAIVKTAAADWLRAVGGDVRDMSAVDALIELAGEYEYITNYKKQFSTLPYAPVFVTGDAVVVQSGHVLLVERGGMPGKGQLALPGGFLDAAGDRSVVDCVVRELQEETGIKVPEKVLRSSIVDGKVFDAIGRSTRGRTITHACYFKLDDTKPLPKVKGQDDAVSAKWYKLTDLNPTSLYEDHWDIITHFVMK